MAAEVGAAGVQAGGQLAGGVMNDAVFKPKENERLRTGAQNQTQEIDAALAKLMNKDNSGLRTVASNELSNSINSLNAGFAMNNAGSTNSGVLNQMQGQIASGVMSNLASQINSDEFNRQLAFLAAKQQPVYQQAATPSRGRK